MGLLPDQFWRLTPGELVLLQDHRLQEIERERENAAFTGYCAAAAVVLGISEGLPPTFEEFYHPARLLNDDELEAECKAKRLKQPDQV